MPAAEHAKHPGNGLLYIPNPDRPARGATDTTDVPGPAAAGCLQVPAGTVARTRGAARSAKAVRVTETAAAWRANSIPV